jgi:hypothetical protein
LKVGIALAAAVGFAFDDLNKKFNEAKLMAKKTGKLLGCALAIGYPFYT